MQVQSLIGIKNYQKHGFLQNGKRIPLTAINVMGNVITQIKTADKEGYSAIQIGIGTNKKANKTKLNHSKKAGLEIAARFFKEITVDNTEGAELGSKLNISDIFAPGDIVDVTGVSKGKGWAGGVKRHGFHGGPRTHGQSDRERAPGSIGQTTTPGRVYKGKKMAGRMGHETVTIKNLEIVEVTSDGVLLIKGLVPGSVTSLLEVKKVGVNDKFVPLYKESPSAEASEGQVAVDEPVAEEALAESVQEVASDAQVEVEEPVQQVQAVETQETGETQNEETENEKEKEVRPSPEVTEDK